ncbi:MAG: polysaccharide deacetylase family protein [Polyangiaceae bacterium]|nr:polysaccharide deacetylase family protein [Polyangiaceae bacterium]
MPIARALLWIASAGALALLARTVLGAAPPPWVAAIALGGYLTLAAVGAVVPQLEMYGDVFWRGEPGTRGVALTFDDGPDPATTPRVLELLHAHGARATFFVIGHKVRLHPELVRRIAADGHAIGVHGDQHDRLHTLRSPRRVLEDLERAIGAVEAATGARPTLFRPPIGHVSPRTVAAARRAGVTIVAWSVRARDGVGSPAPEAVAARIARGLRDGAVVALHDASERGDREPASVRALPQVLDALRSRGLPTVTLDELGAG